jgi:hypothetical protein
VGVVKGVGFLLEHIAPISLGDTKMAEFDYCLYNYYGWVSINYIKCLPVVSAVLRDYPKRGYIYPYKSLRSIRLDIDVELALMYTRGKIDSPLVRHRPDIGDWRY